MRYLSFLVFSFLCANATNNDNLMNLVFQGNTIYTMRTINTGPYGVSSSESTDYSDLYKGTSCGDHLTTPIIGKTLRAVMDEAYSIKGSLEESLLRLKNAIESVGVTAMMMFCEITRRFLSKADDGLLVYISYTLDFLQKLKQKFTEYRICNKPTNALINILTNYQNRLGHSDTDKLLNQCDRFSSRYRGLINLMTIPDWNNNEILYQHGSIEMDSNHLISQFVDTLYRGCYYLDIVGLLQVDFNDN